MCNRVIMHMDSREFLVRRNSDVITFSICISSSFLPYHSHDISSLQLLLLLGGCLLSMFTQTPFTAWSFFHLSFILTIQLMKNLVCTMQAWTACMCVWRGSLIVMCTGVFVCVHRDEAIPHI